MLFNYKPVHFSYLTGPDEEQKKVEPHHTVVVGDGDCVRVEKKVSFLSETKGSPTDALSLFPSGYYNYHQWLKVLGDMFHHSSSSLASFFTLPSPYNCC